MHTSTHTHEDATPPTRRVFIELWEVPALVRGAVTADAVSLRRILGARRGGRWGIAAALAALIPSWLAGAIAIELAAHAAFSISGWYIQRSELGPKQYQRVCLWIVAPALLLTAPLTLALAHTSPLVAAAPGLLATLAAHARVVLCSADQARR